MPAGGTNRTNLASVETAIGTLRSNASTATGDAREGLLKLCRTLERDIAAYKQQIQGLSG